MGSTLPPVGKAAADPIQHVVVLMFENHSFDQMLGCFKAIYPGLEGVDPANPGRNSDGPRQYVQQSSNDTVVKPDPPHDLKNVMHQLDGHNSGFVTEYMQVKPQPSEAQRQRIMDYFGMGDLPVLHELAKHFTICDHWYASVPGPTWANRFFVCSGTSKGLVTMPATLADTKYYLHYDQDTIFDRLNAAGRRWRVYFGDSPLSLVLVHQREPKNAIHYHLMPQFFADVEQGDLPDFTFIEPNYFLGQQNDDHPPHATMRAQRLLARVYNALRKSSLWNSTLFVVLYDEHGGFYDHVEPPAAVPPDDHHDEYSFDRLGVRVPALMISPWVERTFVTTQLDHTSLLRYVSDKWQLGSLTKRVDAAKSLAAAIRTSGGPRTDTPESVKVPEPIITALAEILEKAAILDVTEDELAEPQNDLQRSLKIFAEHLNQNELPTKVPPVSLIAEHLLGEEQKAKAKVQAFLAQQKAKAGHA